MDNYRTNQKNPQPQKKVNINEQNYDIFNSKDENISITFANDLEKQNPKKTEKLKLEILTPQKIY